MTRPRMELTIIDCRAAAAEALCISRYADVCSFRAQASLERYTRRFGDGEASQARVVIQPGSSWTGLWHATFRRTQYIALRPPDTAET